MSERERALVHLAKGWEELLLACAEGLASWRIRLESGEAGAPETGLEALLQLWSDLEARGAAGLLPLLQKALRDERERWERRAAGDAAARRLRDLCSALLDVIEPELRADETAARAPRRAPRRSRAPSS